MAWGAVADGHDSWHSAGLAFFFFVLHLDFFFLYYCLGKPLMSLRALSLPGCTGTFSGMVENKAEGLLSSRSRLGTMLSFVSYLAHSPGQELGGRHTAGLRRGIEYRPSIKLPRPSDGDCGTLVLGGMAMSRLMSHRKTVGSEENANYLRLIIERARCCKGSPIA